MVKRIRLRTLELGTGEVAYVAKVRITSQGQVVQVPGEKDQSTGPTDETYTFTLLHREQGWRVETLKVS